MSNCNCEYCVNLEHICIKCGWRRTISRVRRFFSKKLPPQNPETYNEVEMLRNPARFIIEGGTAIGSQKNWAIGDMPLRQDLSENAIEVIDGTPIGDYFVYIDKPKLR